MTFFAFWCILLFQSHKTDATRLDDNFVAPNEDIRNAYRAPTSGRYED